MNKEHSMTTATASAGVLELIDPQTIDRVELEDIEDHSHTD